MVKARRYPWLWVALSPFSKDEQLISLTDVLACNEDVPALVLRGRGGVVSPREVHGCNFKF